MNKKFKKLLILILVLAIAAFGVYAFFISSPQKIFKGFLTGKDDDEAIAKKDNINGVYLRTEALDDYYSIFTGCRINEINYYIVVINNNYYYYRSSCIATYLLGEGTIDKIPIEYNKETSNYELTYDDGTYVKSNVTSVVPHENVLHNTKTIYIESLEVILRQIEFKDHYTGLYIQTLYNFKEPFGLNLEASESGYQITLTRALDDIITYNFYDLDHVPKILNFNHSVGFLINNSTKDKYSYEMQLVDKDGLKYRSNSKFPIKVDNVELNVNDYNVYIKKVTSSEFSIYLSKYHDFCSKDLDGDEITYYQFKLTYNYGKGTFNDPEFVKKGLAKEGCGKVVPIEEES